MEWVCIYVVLFFVFFIVSKAVYGSIKNPISVFCLLWCIIGVGANAAFYDYYPPATIVNVMIVVACVGTFLIYSISLRGYKTSFFVNEVVLKDEYINVKRILFLNLAGITILLPYIGRSIGMIASGGFGYLRGEDVISNGLVAVLNDSFIRPLFTATAILSIVYSFSKGRKRTKALLLIISIVANIEQVIITAGRASIVNFVFYLMIALILFYGKSIASILRRGRKYILMAFVAAMFVILITSQRNLSKGENLFLYNFYVYYFSGPSYLTQLLEDSTGYGIGGELLYGTATFGFISNILSDIMIFITGRPQGSLYILGSVITSKQYMVGAHTFINAMCTCFYPFIIDFGWLGIAICPVVIGLFSSWITKRVYRETNLCNVSIYIYWIYVIIRTVFKWDLVNLDLTIVFMALWFFTKTKNDYINNNSIANIWRGGI